MAAKVRPDFKLPITEARYFFGRSNLLAAVQRSPFQVRILLGGRRLGKTSALNAIRDRLLNASESQPYRAFPVLFNLQQEQPESLDNLRYLLIARLQEAMVQQKKEQNQAGEKVTAVFSDSFRGENLAFLALN